VFIVNHRKIFFTISILLLILSVGAIGYYGFNLSIDFTGGSILEVSYEGERPEQVAIQAAITAMDLGGFSARPAGERGYVVRTKELDQAGKESLLTALSIDGQYQLTAERFNSIGPVIGVELRHKSYQAIIVVLLCILIFITLAFRKVSRPVASWKYGLVTLAALLHDVIIPTGIFVVYGQFTGAEIDLLFVAALLAILGYSVHDTIVVFDRVRENLQRNQEAKRTESFDVVVGKSLTQTMTRSINTSLTTILALLTLYFLGGSATEHFVFLLLVGMIAGVYSSVFIASPLLVFLAPKTGE